MSVCRNLKKYASKHEHMADFFSLLAISLLFITLYLGSVYYSPLSSWMKQDVIVHIPIQIGSLFADVLLIFLFLNIGSARFAGEEEGCFHTFRGRRSGSGSIGTMFNSWLHHIEQVGRKHR